MKITLGLVFFYITIVHISDAFKNNEYLRRVKRIIGNTRPVGSKVHKFQHVVMLLGLNTYYKEEMFLGFIHRKVPYERKKHCGASMLSNDWVITAAHCLYIDGKIAINTDWIIYVHGVKRKPDMLERYKAQLISYLVHPKYDKVSLENDIALIKIKPVNLNEIYDAGPISLPPPEVTKVSGPEPGERCWYAGWGCTVKNGGLAEQLLEAEFKIQNLNVCLITYGKTKEEWKNNLCVQAPNTSICSGDSGGGLICKSKNGKMYLAGIASSNAGSSNNPEKYPSNFMKVSSYMDWIRRATSLS